MFRMRISLGLIASSYPPQIYFTLGILLSSISPPASEITVFIDAAFVYPEVTGI